MFKAFCLATKTLCQNGWPTFDTTHASNKKRESSFTTTCDDIEFGMKNVMQNSLVSFFCADKSLIQHTHREIVHKEYEK